MDRAGGACGDPLYWKAFFFFREGVWWKRTADKPLPPQKTWTHRDVVSGLSRFPFLLLLRAGRPSWPFSWLCLLFVMAMASAGLPSSCPQGFSRLGAPAGHMRSGEDLHRTGFLGRPLVGPPCIYIYFFFFSGFVNDIASKPQLLHCGSSGMSANYNKCTSWSGLKH